MTWTKTARRSALTVLPDIVDIKPANMEELTEVITAAEFHPHQCNVFVYSSSKGTIRLCDMRSSALCDRHSKCKCLPVGSSSFKSCNQTLECVQRLRVCSCPRAWTHLWPPWFHQSWAMAKRSCFPEPFMLEPP